MGRSPDDDIAAVPTFITVSRFDIAKGAELAGADARSTDAAEAVLAAATLAKA